MNNKKLYNNIIKDISKSLKLHLNENLRRNVGKVTMLSTPVQISNVILQEPIFTDYIHSLWYRNFVLKGGAAFMEKVHGMDSHTFVCNTIESVNMLKKWLQKYSPDTIIDTLN